MNTIGSMEKKDELAAFSTRMHEICEDMKLPVHGRQTALAKIFELSQKGTRKWLEGESWPRWEHVIRISEWANVTIEWLMSGRGAKRIDELYPTKAIARVAQVMQTMNPDQQYLVARLANQITQPPDQSPQDNDFDPPDERKRSK